MGLLTRLVQRAGASANDTGLLRRLLAAGDGSLSNPSASAVVSDPLERWNALHMKAQNDAAALSSAPRRTPAERARGRWGVDDPVAKMIALGLLPASALWGEWDE